jgi:isopenicillin N synthase-like dioxygenase
MDTSEFINIAKDDALAWPKIARRTYPTPTNARMESTIAPFVRKSLAVNATLMDVFNNRLGLPEGELAKRHTMEEFSGSEARCIKNPPKMSEEQTAIGAHTDFGSLVCGVRDCLYNAECRWDWQSFLHNRLGGLQVLVPGTEKWQYVKVRS